MWRISEYYEKNARKNTSNKSTVICMGADIYSAMQIILNSI